MSAELQNVQPYENNEEYRAATEIKDRRDFVKAIEALANAGNIHAANTYGLLLMQSGWDAKRMRSDLARGQLLPPTLDPRDDPYLILGRDPLRAIEYFRFACSDYNKHGQSSAYKLAYAIIDFCRHEGLAGYHADRRVPYPNLSYEHQFVLREYGKNMNEYGTGVFIPVPDARIEVDNPSTDLFKDLGDGQYELSIHSCIIYAVTAVVLLAIIMGIYKDYYGGLKMIGFVFAVNIAPLLIFSYNFSSFGSDERLPTCSCERIRKAFDIQLQGLPAKCCRTGDPFVKTNFIIRNLVGIKQLWLYLFIIFANIVFFSRLLGIEFINRYLYWINTSTCNSLPVFVVVNLLLLIAEKNIPDPEIEWLRFIVTPLRCAVYFVYEDALCAEEVDKLKDVMREQRYD